MEANDTKNDNNTPARYYTVWPLQRIIGSLEFFFLSSAQLGTKTPIIQEWNELFIQVFSYSAKKICI